VDRLAELSVARPDEFGVEVQKAFADPEGYIDSAALEPLALPTAELLEYWREGRTALTTALGGLPRGARAPWFGPPMSAATVATGRIMETWAHGQDVADALGIRREPTARLQHVARIGVKARAYGYMVRDLPVPTSAVRVELTAPDGSLWTWGPPEAPARVSGPALDFCLLVTRRRHRDDLALKAVGEADQWLDVAQSFAGPPGPGREPGRFV
jgi:uncharacterized protein (TIGR03084 family)